MLQALLWGFHNAASGKCFPSYEAIAERASCARSAVAEAIRALERAGILTWCNRLKRVREYVLACSVRRAHGVGAWCVRRTAMFSAIRPKSDFQT